MSDPATSSRFTDSKAPDALRTIGEVSAAFGIKQHILRYWEQQFPMLEPLKRSGGRRYYRADDVALVERIDRLINRDGYTIKGARQVIENGRKQGGDDAMKMGDRAGEAASGAGPPDIIPQLRAIRERLANALETA